MPATGVLSNTTGGIQYHVSGLEAGKTLRFNVTDSHPDTAHSPGPATESASTTTPGSGSHQVNYFVPAGITEKTFLIESSTNMALVAGTTYYVVLASIDYLPYYATVDNNGVSAGHVLQYLPPPADGFYGATVNHGNKQFTLSANPVSQPEDVAAAVNDVHNVTSYLVTIYEHTTTGVAAGKVWQKAYSATDGILDYAGTDTSITIDCMQIIYVEGTTPAQITADPTANVQFAEMELFNSKNYELIVAARNATGTVKTAQTFHVSPRETPNAVQLTVTSGSYTRPLTSGLVWDAVTSTMVAAPNGPVGPNNEAAPAAYNNTLALPNSGTTDNKVEFSITLGDKAGPNGNEHDFAVIVKLIENTADATALYKRINLDNYFTTDVPSAGDNSNSTDNGESEASDYSKFTQLTSQLVASGHTWSTNDNGLLSDGVGVVSLVDGTEYYLTARAINIMTTAPGFEASDSPLNTGFDNTSGVSANGAAITGEIKVTPSGLPIVPTFTDPSTHVGHLTNTIQIRLNGNQINSVMGDEGANGNNGSDILWYYLTVDNNQSYNINFAWEDAVGDVAGYSYYNITTTDGANLLANGTSYDLKLEVANSNGHADVLTNASRAVTIDNITPRTDPAAVLGFDAWPDQAEESILNSGEVGVKVDAFTTPAGTGGDEIADITYQFQLSSTNDFSNTPVRDVSGVGTTSRTFTGLVDGVQYYVRSRAINSAWDNAILDSPTNDSSGNNDTLDNASGGPWTVYATGGVSKTVTPSVPPTVGVGVMTTIADRIVTHSHFHTGDTFGLKVKLGGEATTTTGTVGAGAANADYIVNGIRVTATALSNTDTSFTDIPLGEYTTDKEIAVLAPTTGTQGSENYHLYKLSFQAYNNTYQAGSTDPQFATVESTSGGSTSGGHAHLTNATLPFVLATQQTGDHVVGSKTIAYNWSVENWAATGNFHYPMSDGYDWTRTENAPTLNTTTNAIALAGSWTSPSLGSSDVAGEGTGNLSASSTTGSYSSTGLRDGTSYKFEVAAKAKSHHPLVTSLPASYNDAVSESVAFIPYSKPTVALELVNNGANAIIEIRSNGRVLEDSIVVRAVASTLAIDNITTAVHNSTKVYTDGTNGSALTAAGPYFAGGNPGFTNYFDGTNFASELISVVDGPTAAGYLLLSENAGGATVILNGSITGTNLTPPSST